MQPAAASRHLRRFLAGGDPSECVHKSILDPATSLHNLAIPLLDFAISEARSDDDAF